eukprot:3056012-Alexandrium_andersonii.AAC.1
MVCVAGRRRVRVRENGRDWQGHAGPRDDCRRRRRNVRGQWNRWRPARVSADGRGGRPWRGRQCRRTRR